MEYTDTIKIDSGNVKMVAHRGLSGLEKENTCSAFVAAGNRAAYAGIETDVHRTLDGRFVIIHDDSTARVGIDSLDVENTTYETLKKLRLTDMDGQRGRADLVLPDLEDYIGICRRYHKIAVLELKNHFEQTDIAKIVEIIRGMSYLDHVIFISFDLANLIVLRALLPKQKIQYLLESFSDADLEIMKANTLDLDIDYTALTPEIVQKVHAAGREVNCWTVNDPDAGLNLVAMGVDYITSNILE